MRTMVIYFGVNIRVMFTALSWLSYCFPKVYHSLFLISWQNEVYTQGIDASADCIFVDQIALSFPPLFFQFTAKIDVYSNLKSMPVTDFYEIRCGYMLLLLYFSHVL